MEKTQKELAFLRDLYVTPDWTRRFTELVDKNVKLDDAENVLYINAGTGDHCFAIREKLDEQAAVFGQCENDDLLSIARDKAIAVRSDVDFSTLNFEDDSFDAVVADATLFCLRILTNSSKILSASQKKAGRLQFFSRPPAALAKCFHFFGKCFSMRTSGNTVVRRKI